MRKLIALKQFSYGRVPNKKALWPGDEFEALSDFDAKVLIGVRRAKARETPGPAATLVPAASTPAEPTKRRYKRRDMEAEDHSTPAAASVPSVSPLTDGGAAPAAPAAAGTTTEAPADQPSE